MAGHGPGDDDVETGEWTEHDIDGGR